MTNLKKQSSEAAVRKIRRRTRRKFSSEEEIRIVLEGLRGEESVSDLCRIEGIASNLYYVTPADVYFGRQYAVLSERSKIKRRTMERRKKHYMAQKAA